MNSGDLTITDSTVTINATDKGITVTDELTVEGNSKVTVVAGDEGLEGRYINLTGGTVDITAGDDGINATEWTTKDSADTSSLTNSTSDLENEVGINIDGATVTILADGDGIDSNGNVTVKSGSLYVAQTSADNAAIDYDGTGIISGGTVWAIGNQGMAQAFTTGSSQSYIMANISGSAGDTITVTDSSGNVVATTTATTSFGNVVFSTESLTSGETYTITTSSGASVTATATEEGTNNGPGVGGMGGFPGGGFGNSSMSDNFGGYGGPTSYGGSSTNTGSVNTPWGQSGTTSSENTTSTSSENTTSTSSTSSTSQTANTGLPTPPNFASQTSNSTSPNVSTTTSTTASVTKSPTANASASATASNSVATNADQADATTSATTARSTSPSGQGSSTTRAAEPEVRSLISEVAVANRSAEAQPEQASTNTSSSAQQQAQETAEKLDNILTQKQTSEASKGHVGVSQKENVSSVVQTNFAQKQHTSSKANQSAKSSQSSQANQSTLPDTGDVSSLGLGALGAVLMTTSFALKGSKHSRK